MEVLCTFISTLSKPRNSPFDRIRLKPAEIYTCQIENQVILEDDELQFVGQHLNERFNNNVNSVSFNLCFITKVPRNLLNHFPNLHSLTICGSNLKVLNKDDLIKYRHFKSLNFDSNQIEFLPGDLFEGFENLEKVSFNNNNLRVVEPTIFDGLKKLHNVDLNFNPCLNISCKGDFDYNGNFVVDLYNMKNDLNEAYLARFKFLTDMKNSIANFIQENQVLKKSEVKLNREITDLKRSLEREKSKKSNLNFPHPSCFCNELKEALKDENNFKDFTIMIENEEIHVSKLLLAARSPVLAKILHDNPNADSFNLVDISVQTFKEILKYLYTDKLQFDEITNSMHLFAAAHRLKIKKLKDIVAMNISNSITPENALEILILSNRYEHDKLRQNAFNEVKKNYPKIEFKEEFAVQPEKVTQIVDAFKFKQQKLLRIETMVQNIELEFQNLLN